MFKFSSIYLLAALSTLMVNPAQARPQTFVASFGNDANPCGRVLPCRLLARAIDLTDTNGEVTVLDSANYDPITITKSISITAPPGIYAGIAVPSDDISGVTINANGINVVLRGLTITGNSQDDGTLNSLSAGILMTAGAKLSIENCVISNFSSINSNNLQPGVLVQTPATVRMVNTITRNNEIGALFQAGAKAHISKSKFLGNSVYGIYAFNETAGSTTTAAISNTVVLGSGVGIYSRAITPTASSKIDISRSIVSNAGIGVAAESSTGVTATVSIRKSMVTGSSTGLAKIFDGTMISYGNNTLSNNISDLGGTLTPAAPL
ncbi:MAG: right-handed parallel beta-helix repeat-containing protein [Candidatus Nitrotoga sp.]